MDVEDVGVWLVQYPIVVREAINGSTYSKKNKDHDGLTQLCLCIPGLSFIAPRSEIQSLASLCIGKFFWQIRSRRYLSEILTVIFPTAVQHLDLCEAGNLTMSQQQQMLPDSFHENRDGVSRSEAQYL